MSNIPRLNTLVTLCGGGNCPTLYKDEQGRLFIQGTRLADTTRDQLSIPGHEEVIELAPEMLAYLRTQV